MTVVVPDVTPVTVPLLLTDAMVELPILHVHLVETSSLLITEPLRNVLNVAFTFAVEPLVRLTADGSMIRSLVVLSLTYTLWLVEYPLYEAVMVTSPALRALMFP